MQRRTVLQGLAASALAAPALAQTPSVLRFVPQSNLSAIDPIWTTATVTGNHGYYVYDTLYAADSKMQPQPQMAAGHEVADDGRTWRIRLRDGLRFHDGTPVRAVDCIASVKRWGAREPIGQLLVQVVDQWVPVDDRTMELRLKKPFPLMLDALSKPDASTPFIMPERIAATDPNKSFTEVVGSGPFRFVPDELVSGSRVVYAKFGGYVPRAEPADWAAGGKIAHFDRIEWNIMPDPATASAALMRGEIDWWERPLNDLLPALQGQFRHPDARPGPDRPHGADAAEPSAAAVQRRAHPARGADVGGPGRIHAGRQRRRPLALEGMREHLSLRHALRLRHRGQAAHARRPRCGAAPAAGGRLCRAACRRY